ncbi:hypothetical protein Pmani_027950 [Petrolisthes manimaculis]|uniref:Uncharacterized protein n=1 Tax=Petrolisthes manimaculis TaxID=1843537 RepID=A0AAE1TW03_9EUCA|nr:hypothetical protein Pmani_027950 [Petrolisthes manimaculis]
MKWSCGGGAEQYSTSLHMHAPRPLTSSTFKHLCYVEAGGEEIYSTWLPPPLPSSSTFKTRTIAGEWKPRVVDIVLLSLHYKHLSSTFNTPPPSSSTFNTPIC